MLSHDVSFGPECCKLVTGERADVLLTRRAANKEVQYDALVKSQQERVNGTSGTSLESRSFCPRSS